MKLSQLSLADYNQLDSIPVINQDLSASGFTPVANTYYRHTGATTDTFTQGVIYLYDTAYHKLGESGGDYLTYKGDWATNTEYNVNECVTWTDGHLYQVIKAHTSSSTMDPSNSEYYKAMTASKYYSKSYNVNNRESRSSLISDVTGAIHKHRRALCYLGSIDSDYKICLEFNEEKDSSFYGVVGTGFHRDKADFFPAIVQYFITTEVYELSKTVLSSTGATKTVLTGSTSITIYYEA